MSSQTGSYRCNILKQLFQNIQPVEILVSIILTSTLEIIGPGTWRIRGIYEHQALKIGLRCLDEAWSLDGKSLSEQLPSGLFRAKLMGELLQGVVSLQSITGNIATSQRPSHKNVCICRCWLSRSTQCQR